MPRDEQARQAFMDFRRSSRPQALNEVFDLCAQELLLVAHHLARPGVAPEDLLQQTFLAVIRARADYDESRPLLPWMLGILVNVARSHNRREARRPDPERFDLRASDDPLDAAYAHELAAAVFAQIERLPDPQRKVLTLRLVHGLTPTEIAHALGHPVGTVKSWLHRGIERLKQGLPAGFAASLGVYVDAAPGLDGVRAAVLEFAAREAPAPLPRVQPGGWTRSTPTLAGAVALLALAGSIGIVAALRGSGGGGDTTRARSADRGGSAEFAHAVEQASTGATADTADTRSLAPLATDEGTAGARSDAGLLFARFASDGSPAAARFQVEPRFGSDFALRAFEVATDARGEARLPPMAPGTYEFCSDRGEPWIVDWPAAGLRIDCEIPAGVTLAGRVLDPVGSPIAGARLWLARAGRPGEGSVVAESDANGAFLLRDLPAERCLAAIADGFEPSDLAHVATAASIAATRLDLRVGPRAAVLRGRVLDESGQPVPGARLSLGPELPSAMRANWATTHRLRAPLTLFADARGHFACASAAADRDLRVWTRAPELALDGRRLKLTAGTSSDVDIVLRRGATWSGRAESLAEGATAAFIAVDALGGFDPSTQGELDLPPAWSIPCSYLSPGEDFALTGLAPGEARLRIQDDRGGRATREVHLRDGQRLEWSPSTARVTALRGRITGIGAALPAGLRLRVVPTLGAARRVEVDADGRFSGDGFTPTAHRLWLHGPAGLYPGPWLDLGVAVPGGPELRYELRSDQIPAATIVARLRVGPPGEARKLQALASDGTVVDGSTPGGPGSGDEGWMQFGPLPAGRYHLIVPGAEGPRFVEGPIELAPGQRADLGDLIWREPARLVLSLRALDSRANRALHASLQSEDGAVMLGFQRVVNARAEFSSLPPGRHRLSLRDGAVEFHQRPVDLVEGGDLDLVVDAGPRPRAAVVLRVLGGTRGDVWNAEVRPVAGGDARRISVRDERVGAEDLRIEFESDPGEFSVAVRGPVGQSASGRLRVAATTPSELVLSFH